MGTIVFLVIAFLFGVYAMHKNSGCLLTVFVVVFFFGSILVLNGEGIHPALSFILVVGGTFGAMLVSSKFFPGEPEIEHIPVSESDPHVKQVVADAVNIVNDMAKAGLGIVVIRSFAHPIADDTEFSGYIFLNDNLTLELRACGNMEEIMRESYDQRVKFMDAPIDGPLIRAVEQFDSKYRQLRHWFRGDSYVCPLKDPFEARNKPNDSRAQLITIIDRAIKSQCANLEVSDEVGRYRIENVPH